MESNKCEITNVLIKNKIDLNKDIILKNTNTNLNVNLPYNSFSTIDFNNILLKNKFCYIGKTDKLFWNNKFDINDKYYDFYLNIAKSGVGLIFTGGFPTKVYRDNECKISKSLIENKDKIKDFTTKIHSLGCKMFYTLTSVYGRADYKNPFLGLLNYSVCYNKSYTNSNILCKKISDGMCNKIIENMYFQAILSNSYGFDGIMIDANLFGLIGEFSSSEINLRKLGYYIEIEDFTKKLLEKILYKNKLMKIIYSFSFKTFISEIYGEASSKILSCKNFKKNISNKKIFEFLEKLVKLGVDGFHIQAGTFETEFLSNSTPIQKDNILSSLILSINEYFNSNNIKNKFGNDVFFVYKDFLYDVNDDIKVMDNCIFDFSRQILADNKILFKIRNNEGFKKCIKCGKCENKFNYKNSTFCILSPENERNNFFENKKYLLNQNMKLKDINEKKDVAIIGAGVSGLNCALYLLERGYEVDIFEKRDKINYTNRICEVFGYNYLLKNYNDYLENSLKIYVEEKKLNIYLNKEFSKIESEKYENIVVATGFHTKFLNIPGAVLQNVKNIYEVLENENALNNYQTFVLDAKSELSIILALYLLQKNKKVTILFYSLDFLFEMENSKLTFYLFALKRLNCNVFILPKIKRIESDFVEIIVNTKLDNMDFQSQILNMKSNKKYKIQERAKNIDMDMFIYEPEIYSNNKIYIDIVSSKFKGKVYSIGNALYPCEIDECIKTAFFVAKNI